MLRRIEDFLLNLSAAAVLSLGILITATVVARAAFNSALPDTIVMVRELMVAAIMLPLAAATAERAHIAVEFLADRLPIRIRAWLIVWGSVFGLLALAPLIYAAGNELYETATSGGYFFGELNLPKWPGRALFLVGVFACWVRLLVMVIKDIGAIRAGELEFASTDAERARASAHGGEGV